METKNYCLIDKQTNVCENVVIWDGDTSKWAPADNYLCIPQNEIPTKTWKYDGTVKDFVEIIIENDVGAPGYTWDGTYLIQQKPEVLPEKEQPITEGTQTL